MIHNVAQARGRVEWVQDLQETKAIRFQSICAEEYRAVERRSVLRRDTDGLFWDNEVKNGAIVENRKS